LTLISITEEIAVPAPPARVWPVVSDPAQVVACIGGAELGPTREDGSFDGALVVKFGAVRVRFAAVVRLDLVEEEQVGKLSARGKDGQGGTRFMADATFQVRPGASPAESVIEVVGSIKLSGKLASLVEAGAGAVVGRMTKEFSEQLILRCGGGPPAKEKWWTRLFNRIFKRGARHDRATAQ
jgi:carbon monoxide dehydrogenase subunit G